MKRVVSVILLAASVLLPHAPAGGTPPEACATLRTGIDRERLLFYVRDAAEADSIAIAVDDLSGLVERAEDWLQSAGAVQQDMPQAVQNARGVARRVEKDLPALRSRLAGLPDSGPEFPPVFYWPKGWKRFMASVLDAIEIRAAYLRDELSARSREDWDAMQRLLEARNADLIAFETAFAAFDRELVQLLPADHPDRAMLEARMLWNGLTELYAERDKQRSDQAARDVSVSIVRKLEDVASKLDALAPQLEKAIAAYGAHILPIFVTLTCDEVHAGQLRDAYIASYRAHVELMRAQARLVRDYARVTLAYVEDGATPEIFERFSQLGFRYERLWREISERWSERTEMLKNAIADDGG